MPEGQTTVSPTTPEGQFAPQGSEGQGPAEAPPRTSEGQVKQADLDNDLVDGQDGDTSSIHPSSGGFPNTQATIGQGAHLSGGMPAMKRTNF